MSAPWDQRTPLALSKVRPVLSGMRFRHRRRLGMEPVLEALKDAISQRRLNVYELCRQAQRMQRALNRCGRE